MIKQSQYLKSATEENSLVTDFILLTYFIFSLLIAIITNIWQPIIFLVPPVVILWALSAILKNSFLYKVIITLELNIFMLIFMLQISNEFHIEFFFIVNLVLLIFYEDFKIIIIFTIWALVFICLFYLAQKYNYNLLAETFRYSFSTYGIEIIYKQLISIFIMAVICAWISIEIKNKRKNLLNSHLKIEDQYIELKEKNAEMNTLLEEMQQIGEVLNENNNRLATLSIVAQKTDNIVVITDKKGVISWVNDSFERITGFNLLDVYGTKGEITHGSETNPENTEKIKETIINGESISVEVVNYKKNGEKIWLLVNLNPIFDLENKITNYVSIETDVTERKFKEQNIRKLNEDIVLKNNELWYLKKQSAAFNREILSLSKSQFIQNGDLEQTFRTLAQISCFTLKASRTSIWMFNKESTAIECRIRYNFNTNKYDIGEKIDILGNEDYFSLVYNDNLIIDDITDNKLLNRFKQKYLIPANVFSIMNISIFIKGSFSGVLCIEQQKLPRNWTHAEVGFSKSISDFISLAYEASYRKEVEQIIIENKHEIEIVNANLEKIIKERTEDNNLRNKKLEEYAYLNSHILRGPMCRVTGLIYLIENNLAGDEIDLVLLKLKESMLEFDLTTQEISRILEDDDYFEGKYLDKNHQQNLDNSMEV